MKKAVYILFFIGFSIVSTAAEKETITEYEVAHEVSTEVLRHLSKIINPPQSPGPNTWRTQSSFIEITHELALADSVRVKFDSGESNCIVERSYFIFRRELFSPGEIILSEGVRLKALEVVSNEDETIFKVDSNDYKIKKITCTRNEPVGEPLTVGEVERTFGERAEILVRIRDIPVRTDLTEREKLIEKSRSRSPL